MTRLVTYGAFTFSYSYDIFSEDMQLLLCRKFTAAQGRRDSTNVIECRSGE